MSQNRTISDADRRSHAALFTVAMLAAASVLALSALAAGCGGEMQRPDCPPAQGSALGGAASQSCGCFVQVAPNASADEVKAAIDAQMRATNPSDCLFKADGATDRVRAASGEWVNFAVDQMRSNDPDDSPRPTRAHYSLEYE